MLHEKPKVSVVIPTYNRAFFLKEAIESVLEQTFMDYEIIVVNDGSTDDTGKVIQEFGPRIKYYYQENQGRSNARNCGIRAAIGEYIAFLDSDDVFLPEKLAIQVKALDDNPEYGMVYTHALAMDEERHLLDICWKGDLSGWIYPKNMFIKNCFITTPTVMVRTSIFEHVGVFDENMNICEDLDLWRRIARNYPILQIRKPLVNVRVANSVLRMGINVYESLNSRIYFYEKAFSEDPILKKTLKTDLYWEMYYLYGNTALQQGKKIYAIRLLLKSFIWKPCTIIDMVIKCVIKLSANVTSKIVKLCKFVIDRN